MPTSGGLQSCESQGTILPSFRDVETAIGQGSIKELMAMKNLYNKKIVTNNACFCSATMLTSKIRTKIIENYSEVSGCASSCIKSVSSRS